VCVLLLKRLHLGLPVASCLLIWLRSNSECFLFTPGFFRIVFFFFLLLAPSILSCIAAGRCTRCASDWRSAAAASSTGTGRTSTSAQSTPTRRPAPRATRPAAAGLTCAAGWTLWRAAPRRATATRCSTRRGQAAQATTSARRPTAPRTEPTRSESARRGRPPVGPRCRCRRRRRSALRSAAKPLCSSPRCRRRGPRGSTAARTEAAW